MNTQYIFIGFVSIALGLSFATVAWTHIHPYWEDTSDAEAVDAVVLSSNVDQDFTSEGTTAYAPNVTYRYTYKGTEYTSNSVFPGDVDLSTSVSRARDIVARHPEGEEVTAYVNSEDPTSAFLIDTQAPRWFWAGPVIGVLMILYGAHSIRLGVRGVEPSAEIA